MNGFRTILVGAALAVLPSLSEYVAHIDWSFLGPKTAMAVGGGLMILMRIITNSPVFQKKD